jgi:ceramide glucosyltransferase
LAVGFGSAIIVLNDQQFFRSIFFLPLRDLIAPLVWAASFVGNRIHWRGDVFELKDGRLSRYSK